MDIDLWSTTGLNEFIIKTGIDSLKTNKWTVMQSLQACSQKHWE